MVVEGAGARLTPRAVGMTVGGLAEATNAGELARYLGPISILAEIPFQEDDDSFAASFACLRWHDRCERPRYRALYDDQAESE